MNSDRDGRRNNRGRERYNARGYKRGRGHYYSQNYSWKQSKPYHQNQYAIPPQKPPSPLPGTEEYRQRHIQQTSELIKKQLNIDSETCDNSSVTIPNLNLASEPVDPDPPQPSTSTAEPKKRTRRKRVEEIVEEEIDVQDLYDKIIKHICNLSHSKKINLIQQGNVGYDIALQQIQKQKQLELSRALRDMSKRPTQADKDGEVINAIIPDIGIKLEDLPNSVIKELSKTLQVKFEDNGIVNLLNEDTPLSDDFTDTIENIFDFEYLNKAQDDPDLTFEVNQESFNEGDFGSNSDFNLDDIDVSKSYLTPTNSNFSTVDNNFNDARSSDGYPVIRVKRDLFESGKVETVTAEKPLEPQAQEMSNIFSSQLQKNVTESCIPDVNNVFNKIFESGNKKSFISPLDDVRYRRNSPMLRKLPSHRNRRQEQTENTESENRPEHSRSVTPPKQEQMTPKRWKSPGEKKMINYEQSIASSDTSTNENAADVMSIFQQMEEFNRCMSVVSEKQKKSGTKQSTVDPKSAENGLVKINELDKPVEKEIAPELEEMICEKIPDLVEDQIGSNEITMATNVDTDSTKGIEEYEQSNNSMELSIDESIKMDFSPSKISSENNNCNDRDSTDKKPKEMKEIGTMTDLEILRSSKKVKLGTDISNMTNIDPTQTPPTINKPKLKNIAMQTVQKQFHSAEVQAVQTLQTKISQTDTSGLEIDEFKTKCKSYSVAIKKLREIDDQIQNLIEQKNKIYEMLKFTPNKKSKKSEARNSGESSKPKKSKEDKKKEETQRKPDTSKHKPDNAPKKKKHKHDDDDVEHNKKKRKISVNPVSTPITTVKKNDAEQEEIPSKPFKKAPIVEIPPEKPEKSSKATKNDKISVNPVATPITTVKKNDTEQEEIPSRPFKKPAIVEIPPEKPEKPSKATKNDKIEPKSTEPKKQLPYREMRRSKSKDRENLPTTSSDDNVKYFDKEKRIKISKECETLLVKDDKLFSKKCCVDLLGYPVSVLQDLKKTIKKSGSEKDLLPIGKVGSNEDHLLDCSVVSVKDDSSNHSSDGTTTITTSPSVSSSSGHGKKRAATNSKVIDKTEFKGTNGTIFALESVDDILLAAADNGVLYFFKILSKELLDELNLSTKALTSLFITRSNEECLIYVGSLDGNLRVVDLKTRQLQKTVNVESGIQCIDVRWGFVFMGSITGEILIYDIKKLKLESPIKIYENRIYAVRATQEGARRVLLTSTKDSDVSVRDAMTGLLLRTMQSQLNPAPTVYTILQDQNLVYCASSQHDVLVYSFQNGDLVNRYDSLAKRRVVCMQIVGNLIYVGCFNGTVCVFHKSTHRYLGQMIRRGEFLISMLIVKNKVIVGTKNNKLVSWDIPNTYLERDA